MRPGARINPNARRPPHHHPAHDPKTDEYRGSSADHDNAATEPNPEAPEDEGYEEELTDPNPDHHPTLDVGSHYPRDKTRPGE